MHAKNVTLFHMNISSVSEFGYKLTFYFRCNMLFPWWGGDTFHISACKYLHYSSCTRTREDQVPPSAGALVLANVLLLPLTLALTPHTQSNEWEEKLIFACFVVMEEEPFPNLLPEESIQ